MMIERLTGMGRLFLPIVLALFMTACTSGVEPVEIDEVWVFQHNPAGGSDTALHSGVAEIKDGCLYVDDAVVVWRKSQIDQAENLIKEIRAGEQPDVRLGGGGISLDEGDTPIPSVITDLCPTRVVWYSSP